MIAFLGSGLEVSCVSSCDLRMESRLRMTKDKSSDKDDI